MRWLSGKETSHRQQCLRIVAYQMGFFCRKRLLDAPCFSAKRVALLALEAVSHTQGAPHLAGMTDQKVVPYSFATTRDDST